MDHKYDIGSVVWYINTRTYIIKQDIISHKGVFYKEYKTARQLVVDILQENTNPSEKIIDDNIKCYMNHNYHRHDKPYETEGYCFDHNYSNVPVEFIDMNYNKLMNTKFIIYNIFNRILKFTDVLLTPYELELARDISFYIMKYFK